MTIEQLSVFLNKLTEEITDFPSYDDLSGCYGGNKIDLTAQTSAYTFFLDTPDDEKIPTSGIDKSFTGFHNKNPGWFTGSGIVTIGEIDIKSAPMNFRYISTPDTTLALCYGYDMRNKEQAPSKGLAKIKNMMSDVSDHVIYKENQDASAKDFLDKLKDGVEHYRYCIFFEFSHGSRNKITLYGGLKKNEIFDVLKNARNRIFGLFDSCYSQSMILTANINSQDYYMNCDYDNSYKIQPSNWDHRGSNPTFKSSIQQENLADSIIDALEYEFRNGVPKTSFGHAPTVQDDDTPIIMLWSSTGENNAGWYHRGIDTDFCTAMGIAWKNHKDDRYVNKGETDGFWPSTQKEGTSHWNSTKHERCKPCMRTFEPKDDDNNKFVYLFSLR